MAPVLMKVQTINNAKVTQTAGIIRKYFFKNHCPGYLLSLLLNDNKYPEQKKKMLFPMAPPINRGDKE